MKHLGLALLTLVWFSVVSAQDHPSIMLTRSEVKALRVGVDQYPLLTKSFKSLRKAADKALQSDIMVPQPSDEGGGATHERHRRNYLEIQACGMAYQVTGEKKYADFVKNILLKYADVYSSWPRHPKRKEEPGGKMFWQNLNDCVWLVYAIQGYDCVYDFLSPQDRKRIEAGIIEPAVKELSEVNGEIFNKIHNHGTWSAAAVGMAGYVCGRKDWVEKALKGTNLDGKSGFLAQLDQLFSPDGYYAEGPYYQRYAILPFILFARAINRHQPELKIYAYRNDLLKKAVDISLQSTYTNKVFFPFNDAIKDKTYESEELVYAVDIAYADMNAGNELLDIAEKQGRVIVSDAGLKVARAIAEGKVSAYKYRSIWIRDGAKGDEGGVGILRSGSNEQQTCLVFKAASQGMGHGHFDRLNILLYDNNSEVFSDYGAARFLNIETKSGGRYTKENNTWAKQTVAHNTMVVDEKSHFDGNLKKASASAPELLQFEVSEDFQVLSAVDDKAVPGVRLERTVMLFKPEGAASPLIIDLFRGIGKGTHKYDLPFWYQGQMTYSSFALKTNTAELRPMGTNHGYQHIWVNAIGKPGAGSGTISILNNRKFYSTTFVSDTATSLQFVTAGANDPDFNIRPEKGFILSHSGTGSHSFLTITEPHGNTDPVSEATSGAKPQVKGLKLIQDDGDVSVFEFRYKSNSYTVRIDHKSKKTNLTKK